MVTVVCVVGLQNSGQNPFDLVGLTKHFVDGSTGVVVRDRGGDDAFLLKRMSRLDFGAKVNTVLLLNDCAKTNTSTRTRAEPSTTGR